MVIDNSFIILLISWPGIWDIIWKRGGGCNRIRGCFYSSDLPRKTVFDASRREVVLKVALPRRVGEWLRKGLLERDWGEGWKETMVFCSCSSFFYSWLSKDSNSFHWFKYSSKNENDSLTSRKGFRKIVKVKFLKKLRKKCLAFPSFGLRTEIYRVNLAVSPNAGK